jgi:hypothetical protein
MEVVSALLVWTTSKSMRKSRVAGEESAAYSVDKTFIHNGIDYAAHFRRAFTIGSHIRKMLDNKLKRLIKEARS